MTVRTMQALWPTPQVDRPAWPDSSLYNTLLADANFYPGEDRALFPSFFSEFKEPGNGSDNIQLSASPEATVAPHPHVPVRTARTTARILLADDHETVRRGVRAMLATRKDYELIDVANGADAVLEARTNPPDLVILDLTMPALDGFSAAHEIRKFLPNVPILFFSMHQQTDALLSLTRARNVQGFVCKTEPGSVLLAAVEALLAKKEFFPPGF